MTRLDTAELSVNLMLSIDRLTPEFAAARRFAVPDCTGTYADKGAQWLTLMRWRSAVDIESKRLSRLQNKRDVDLVQALLGAEDLSMD